MAYTTGHVARAAGGESNLYFTKTFLTFKCYGWGGGGGKGGCGKRNPVN